MINIGLRDPSSVEAFIGGMVAVVLLWLVVKAVTNNNG